MCAVCARHCHLTCKHEDRLGVWIRSRTMRSRSLIALYPESHSESAQSVWVSEWEARLLFSFSCEVECSPAEENSWTQYEHSWINRTAECLSLDGSKGPAVIMLTVITVLGQVWCCQNVHLGSSLDEWKWDTEIFLQSMFQVWDGSGFYSIELPC